MSKVFAILGDIHANLEALNAVLDDCRANSVTDFLCTGDIVGYNACPRECLKIVRELACPVVKGNHDYYVATAARLDDLQPHAAAVVEWTRDQMSEDDLAYLASLPFAITKAGVSIVHGTMDAPERFGYVFDLLQAEANFLRQSAPLCFHGHTHCPMIYEKQLAGVYRIDPQTFKLPLGRKYFINVGSVGQPRDGDWRSSYAIYRPELRTVEFRRVEYDLRAAQERIIKAKLPARLAARLESGE